MLINRKAFTIIELLVVVAIIGILAAVGVVAYNGYTSSAKQKVVQQNIKSIYKLWSVENARCLAMDSSEPVLNSYTDGTSIGIARCECMNVVHVVAVNIFQYIFTE